MHLPIRWESTVEPVGKQKTSVRSQPNKTSTIVTNNYKRRDIVSVLQQNPGLGMDLRDCGTQM